MAQAVAWASDEEIQRHRVVWFVVSLIAVLCDLRVLLLFYTPNSRLREPVFVPFRLVFVSDSVWAVSYFLYCAWNLSQGKYHRVDEDAAICWLYGMLNSVWIVTNLFSIALLWYALHSIIHNSLTLSFKRHSASETAQRVTRRITFVSIFAAVVALLMSLLGDSPAPQGGYYCGISAFSPFGIMIISVFCPLCMGTILVYTRKTTRTIQEVGASLEAGTGSETGSVTNAAVRRMRHLGNATTLVFFMCWVPPSASAILMMISEDVSQRLVYGFGSILLTFQPIFNVLIVLRSPLYTKKSNVGSRSRHRVQPGGRSLQNTHQNSSQASDNLAGNTECSDNEANVSSASAGSILANTAHSAPRNLSVSLSRSVTTSFKAKKPPASPQQR